MFSTPVSAEFSQKEASGTLDPQSVKPEALPQADQAPTEERPDGVASGQKQADKPAERQKTRAAAETANKVKAAPKTKTKPGNQAKAKTADKVKNTVKKDGKQTVKTKTKKGDKKHTEPAAGQKIEVASKDSTSAPKSQSIKVEL